MAYARAAERIRARRWRSRGVILGAVLAAILSTAFWLALAYYGATEAPQHPDSADRTYNGP